MNSEIDLWVRENGKPQHVESLSRLNEKLAAKSEPDLRWEAFSIERHRNNPSIEWLHSALNAQMELARRADARAADLAKKTTWISALIGAGATVFGVILGAVLSHALGS